MTNTDRTHKADSTDRPRGASAGGRSETARTSAAAVSRLDRETVSRIAAGEVVTRPASVVKELVENSLDAGAGRITVAVAEGGKKRIRVADNGRGMEQADAALAVSRHTTSKISAPGDVDRVSTLGFRGEALASIARMGTLTLTTKSGGTRGTEVVVENGEKSVSVAGRDVGTTVEVEDLFRTTPARRKSLSSTKREFAAISETVSRYALCSPDVRFRLEHNSKSVFSTPGSGRYTDAVLGVYGREVASQSVALERRKGGERNTPSADGDDGDCGDDGEHGSNGWSEAGVTGLLAYPSVTRSTREHVHVAINGRPVENDAIREAALAGYGSLLPADRYPVCVLRVSVPPETVDVNVHPTKATVALRDPKQAGETVETRVREALRGADLARVADLGFDLDSSLGPVETDSVFEGCTVIGQFRETYLLCGADEDLLVIDQHAAHERINYERLCEAVSGTEIESTSIDPPVTVALSPTELAILDAERERIGTLGFAVESVGGGMARVAGVPAPFGQVATPEAIRDVLGALGNGERAEDPREESLKTLACHPSLKAGTELSNERAEELLARLGACEQPFSCPHGRPTVLSIDERAFVRGFERTQRRLG